MFPLVRTPTLFDFVCLFISLLILGVVDGTEIWVAAENAYNERVARVENQIIARLRDRLGTARNANEMFRVFSKFNALFVRPKVRVVFRVVFGQAVLTLRNFRFVGLFKNTRRSLLILSRRISNVYTIR
jgi:Dynein heavy chain, N-terminal region 1